MNVHQGNYAILTQSSTRNIGKKVFVLWEDRIDPVLGLLWKVRFERPVTLARFSTESGRFVHLGVEIERDGVVPDNWLMRLNLSAGTDPAAGELLEGAEREAWDEHAKGIGIDLYPDEPPPKAIDAELAWPDGWAEASAKLDEGTPTPDGTKGDLSSAAGSSL